MKDTKDAPKRGQDLILPEKYFDPFPRQLFDDLPPGSPMARMVELVESCETKYQPAFRWAAALAWMGTLAGRKIRTSCDLRTNLYILAIAGTARGKDAALNALSAIDEASTEPDGNPMTMAFSHSDAGLLHGLRISPSSLSVVDELGRVLSGMMAPEAEAGNKRLITTMMGLSTSAHRRYRAPRYADPTKNIEVNQPCWSLYGATTPGNFIEGLTSESLQGGMLPRTLPFIGYQNPERRDRGIATPHQSLVTLSRAWREFVPAGNSSMTDWEANPCPSVWEFSPEALKFANSQCEWWDHHAMESESIGIPAGLLYTRAGEQMKKVSLILAANRHGPTDHGAIELPEVENAIKLVDYSLKNFVRLVGNLIADTPHGRRVARLLDFIQRYGSEGVPKHLARSNFSSLAQFQWDQMLAQILESEQAFIWKVKEEGKRGRPGVRLVSSKYSLGGEQ